MVLIELKAMQGAFDQARSLGVAALELVRELGVSPLEVPVMEALRDAEILAGDLEAAERYGRRGCELLAAQGDLSHLSTYAGRLAYVLYWRGNLDEAFEQTEVCRTTAASDDTISQSLWRSVRAMILARRGDFDGAVTLAVEAVRTMDGTDAIDSTAYALMDQYETLRLAGRDEEARAAAREALAMFERKGNVVSAEKTRVLLSSVGSSGPA
jgi:ATP/maltotriose-dependent transcriptional regulator MalT